MTKSVILYSGGLDSTTILYFLLKRTGDTVYPLFINYGQKLLEKELESLRYFIRKLKEEYPERLADVTIVDLTSLGTQIFLTSSLVNPTIKVPKVLLKKTDKEEKEEEEEEEEEEDSTNVPFRGNIFVSLAVPFAITNNCNQIFMMNTATYPELEASHYDGNIDSLRLLKQLVWIGSNYQVTLVTPFENWLKGDIIKLAKSLEVPIERTYSCYTGNTEPCGVCRACYERKRGLIEESKTIREL